MADINSAMHGLQFMQQNAQAALPVIPNNGNPNGAYNMATMPAQQRQPAVPPAMPSVPAERFPWLKPSQSMENVKNLLAQRKAQQQLPMQAAPQLTPSQRPAGPALPIFMEQLR